MLDVYWLGWMLDVYWLRWLFDVHRLLGRGQNHFSRRGNNRCGRLELALLCGGRRGTSSSSYGHAHLVSCVSIANEYSRRTGQHP